MAEKKIIIPEKEIQAIENSTKEIALKSGAIKITSQDKLLEAQDLRKRIVAGKKYLEEKKRSVLAPANDTVKAIRDFFRPYEEQLDSLDVSIGKAIISYKQVMDQKVQTKRDEIVKAVNEGKISFEEGAKRVEKQEVKVAEFKVRKIPTLEIVDESKIPREYLMPNMDKLKVAVIKENLKVPGVERVIREIPVA